MQVGARHPGVPGAFGQVFFFDLPGVIGEPDDMETVPVKDNGCSLKAYRAEVIKNIPLYSEMHRFIPAMASIAGARIAEIKVKHHARQFGLSKYGLSRIYKVLLDLLAIKTIVSFAARPLLWFSILALPAALISLILMFTSIYGLVVHSARLPIPIAGTGVLFGALAFSLVLSGALSELIYKTGDIRVDKLSSLTSRSFESGSKNGSRIK